jgi:hypothetical protein
VDRAERTEEERQRFVASYSDWLTHRLHVEVGTALDRFESVRFVSVMASATTHLRRDHLAAHMRIESWFSRGTAAPRRFTTRDLSVTWRSNAESGTPGWSGRTGVSHTSDAAPLALWPGAGDTLERTALLRGRQLVRRNVLSGEVFGRGLAFATVERQHPVWRSPYGVVAVAGFADAARAWNAFDREGLTRGHVDAGAGLRLARPGDRTQLRIDLGVGLRDGSVRISAGYVAAWGR